MPLATRAATAGLLLVLVPATLAQAPTVPARADSIASTVLPVRSVREVVALDPAFRRDLATGTLVFRARTGGLGSIQEPVFVVDGVRQLGGPMGASTLSLLGASDVPFAAVRRIETLGGFVPADVGEAGGGVVRIATHDGLGAFGARVEGFSSEATDTYGARLASATVRAPFGAGLGGVSLTGEVRRTGDAVPSAGRALRLTDDATARIQDAPQAIRVRDAAGVRLVAFPTAAALAALAAGQPFTVPDALAALGLGTGTAFVDAFPIDAADALTDADFERVRAQDAPITEASVAAQVVLVGSGAARLRTGGVFQFRTADATAPTPGEAFARRFANRDGLSRQRDSRASVFLAAERVTLPAGIEATARLSADVAGSLLRPAAFSDDLADALRYGDADDDVFAAGQRVLAFSTGRGYVLQNTFDGADQPSLRTITGFARPGTAAGVYDSQSAASLQASGRLERVVGAHRLSVGGEVEAQTFRRFTLDGLALAVYANDGNGLPVPGLPTGVDRYDQLTFDALRSSVRTYGYTFNGLDTADDENVAGYFPDRTGVRSDTDVAPFRPLTAAGYVRDEFRVGPVEIDAGLRLERYDARATTLFDPFTTVPIQRAGALTNAPSGIGADFAVYYANNGATLVGFRDRAGQFYDAAGAPATSDLVLLDLSGAAQQISGGSTEGVFAPTRGTTRLQPRLSMRALVTATVSVSAYAMRASRRPDPSLYVPFSAYDQISQQSALQGNADLRPENVRAAGAGVRVRLSNRATVGAEAFARRTTDMPEARIFIGGLPSYGGARNTAHLDEQGVDLTARLAPVDGVEIAAGYTLARARTLDRGSGLLGGLLFDGDVPSSGDTRHAIDLAAEARTPASAGLLGGVGVGVVLQAQSGLPYTALLPNTQFSVFDSFTPGVSGTVGGARLPWTVQADVRLEKRVALGAGSVTAFVWVENVLGTRNTLALYRATGQPDADGFPATLNGQRVLDTPGLQTLYAGYTGGPVNVGGRQSTGAPFTYGQPRQVRLGLVLGL